MKEGKEILLTMRLIIEFESYFIWKLVDSIDSELNSNKIDSFNSYNDYLLFYKTTTFQNKTKIKSFF